jgi:hypothetical protein
MTTVHMSVNPQRTQYAKDLPVSPPGAAAGIVIPLWVARLAMARSAGLTATDFVDAGAQRWNPASEESR